MRKTNKKVRFDLVMRDEKFPRNWVRTGIHSVSPRRVNRIHQQAESGQYPNQPSKNRCRSFPRGVVTAKRLSNVRIQSREMCQDQQSISMRYGPRLTLFLNAIIKRNSIRIMFCLYQNKKLIVWYHLKFRTHTAICHSSSCHSRLPKKATPAPDGTPYNISIRLWLYHLVNAPGWLESASASIMILQISPGGHEPHCREQSDKMA